MTPTEFKSGRHKLGLSCKRLARLFQLSEAWGDRTVRRWEDGSQDIPGPVQVLMKWLITGKRPKF